MSQNAYPHAIQTVNFYGEQIQINAEFGLICCSPILLQKINHTLVSFTQAVGRENLRYLPGFSKQRPFIAAKILHDFLESASNEGADVEIFDVYDKTLEAMAEFHLVRSENQTTREAETPRVNSNSTNALINIQQQSIGNNTINAVSARELHELLQVSKKYADWIKYQIESLQLVDNVDYISLSQKREGNNATMVTHYVTLEIAKHISMASRCARGREIRDYFIECEKKAQAPKVPHKPESKIKHMINAAAMRVAHMMIEGMKISPERKTLARAEILHQQFGISLESLLSDTDPMLSATAIADKLGISSNMIGRLVTRLKIRDNPALAQARLSKSAHSSKEVEQWFYDPKVVDIIRQHIGEQDTRGVDELALA